MTRTLVLTATTAMLAAVLVPPASAETVRLHGATTVVNVVITPHRAAVEKATGHTLEIVGNATGKGLVDLSDGKADAAMVSEPMDIALSAAEAAGKKLDPKQLMFHEMMTDEIVFVVHPANPVTKLSMEQLKDIHTGKITNWKQVGGKDQPITVYSDAVTGGTRAMVKKVVLGGTEYASTVKSLTAVARVADMVTKDESGVGGIGKGFVAAGKTKIIECDRIERPLALVTVGEPSAKVKQVLEAFRSASK